MFDRFNLLRTFPYVHVSYDKVPGVNSQVKQFITALNNGVEFPDISPTSPAFSHYDETPKSVGGKVHTETLLCLRFHHNREVLLY